MTQTMGKPALNQTHGVTQEFSTQIHFKFHLLTPASHENSRSWMVCVVKEAQMMSWISWVQVRVERWGPMIPGQSLHPTADIYCDYEHG